MSDLDFETKPEVVVSLYGGSYDDVIVPVNGPTDLLTVLSAVAESQGWSMVNGKVTEIPGLEDLYLNRMNGETLDFSDFAKLAEIMIEPGTWVCVWVPNLEDDDSEGSD